MEEIQKKIINKSEHELVGDLAHLFSGETPIHLITKYSDVGGPHLVKRPLSGDVGRPVPGPTMHRNLGGVSYMEARSGWNWGYEHQAPVHL